MTTIEKNKLIAEFMSGKYSKDVSFALDDNEIWLPQWGICRYNTVSLWVGKTIRYHESWDWLIPVVEKIESLPDVSFFLIQKNFAGIYISQSPKQITHRIESGELVSEQEKTYTKQKDSKMEAVYYCIVEFVKWYNDTTRIN
jgi:hypothetical protein